MAFKKVTIHFRLSDDIIDELKATYPTIIKYVENEMAKTVFIVDVTPEQQTQIVPVLRDKLVKVEDVVWPPP